MNIQIFGKAKCFDTQKAERWFKERRIRVQRVDVLKYPMSMGELKSVVSAVGLDALIDTQARDYAQSMLAYLSGAQNPRGARRQARDRGLLSGNLEKLAIAHKRRRDVHTLV